MRPNEEKGGRSRHRHHDHKARGAKTFRRGRAIAFLEMIQLKRTTIKQQLEAPEFESIKPILIGELKALDMVINEFTQLFDLEEYEGSEESSVTLKEDENKGDEADETNQ